MFLFTGLVFLSTLTSANLLSAAPLNAITLSCISINNQECKEDHKLLILMEMNLFFAFSVKTSKCSSICNNINNSYVKFCVSDVAKIFNVKVFNLMSRTNETRDLEWHKTCKCKYKLDASA